jgi:NADH:ubiquinone oxidoreductase subunit 2 (subunit N)
MGVLGSALILMGISFYYGLAGTLEMGPLPAPYAFLPLIFLLSGFSVKSGILPFSLWIPELYETTNSSIGSFFSGVIAKGGILGIVLLIFKLVNISELMPVPVILALVSMTIANFSGFREKNLRRLLGFSSISHLSYIVLGISSLSEIGLLGSLFNVFNHAIVILILFFSIEFYEMNKKKMTILGIEGAFWESPVLGLFTIIGLIAAMGMPGTSVFFGEYMILLSWVEQPFVAFVMVLNLLLASAYYLKVIQSLIGEKNYGKIKLPLWGTLILLILSASILVLSIYPDLVISIINTQQFIRN